MESGSEPTYAELKLLLTAKDATIASLSGLVEQLNSQCERLAARVEELERQRGRDSSNSGKPPFSAPGWAKHWLDEAGLLENAKRLLGGEAGRIIAGYRSRYPKATPYELSTNISTDASAMSATASSTLSSRIRSRWRSVSVGIIGSPSSRRTWR